MPPNRPYESMPPRAYAASADSVLIRPVVGTALTVLAGLSFQATCTLLPLVGPSGAVTPHAGKNFLTFLLVLLVTLALSLAATASKMARREVDQSPLPLFSLLLSGLSALLLLALLLGLLKI